MRDFNEFEKNILRFMVNHSKPQDVCTITLFDKFCDTYYMEWTDDYSSFNMIIADGKSWDEVKDKIFDVVVLLQYLESYKYIGIFGTSFHEEHCIYNHAEYELKGNSIDDYSIWKKDGQIEIKSNNFNLNGNFSKIILPTQMKVSIRSSIGKEIEYYANSNYHVTQTLKDYVNNGFKTDEDLRFEKTLDISNKNLKTAKNAIIVAVIIGIVSPILNTCTTKVTEFISHENGRTNNVISPLKDNIIKEEKSVSKEFQIRNYGENE